MTLNFTDTISVMCIVFIILGLILLPLIFLMVKDIVTSKSMEEEENEMYYDD
jgi:hypothetical protein